MQISQITEGLQANDLQSLVKNVVSVAEFEPKTGTSEEATVIGFYVDDVAPGQDLSGFIERGSSKILDTEVSANPDEEGFYMVFVEIETNDNLMQCVCEILQDATMTTGIENWNLHFFSGTKIKLTPKQIDTWLKKQ